MRSLIGKFLRTPADDSSMTQLREQLDDRDARIKQLQRRVKNQRQEITGLRARLIAGDAGSATEFPRPENVVWMLGVGRTGSTWLAYMMSDLENHSVWMEPYVGNVFGQAYYQHAWDWQRTRKHFILSNPYREVWLRSIRSLVLEGARARFPEAGSNNHLVIKEPNGSMGATLLMEALPESRMIFLVRDPRDVISSRLDAHRKGSWTSRLNPKQSGRTSPDENPDAFVEEHARIYQTTIEKVRQAYRNHAGPKVLVKYEDLRYAALEELRRIYARLGIPVEDNELQSAVEANAWERIPDEEKGVGKPRRKATPGGWREDLTEEQARIVEETCAPIIEEFYS